VFALAVTLHECLLGRRPFDGDNPRDVMDAIRQAKLGATHDFGDLQTELPELVALLRRALAKEPAQRGDAAELAHALAAARRRQPAVGAFDLAVWVSEALDERKPVVDAGLETLGMDEDG
jgi:serine/threonine-protein kinase